MKKKNEKTREERIAEINFGKMIRKLRNEFKYTQNDLADRTNLTTQTISTIENHGQNLGIGTIKLFAIAFDMTMSEFFSHFEE
jgi:HTH-type transcriptional repressor of puuD